MNEELAEAEEHEENVYGANARERLEKNDEISPEENAFMEGFENYEEEEEEEDDDSAYEEAFEKKE